MQACTCRLGPCNFPQNKTGMLNARIEKARPLFRHIDRLSRLLFLYTVAPCHTHTHCGFLPQPSVMCVTNRVDRGTITVTFLLFLK